MNSTVADARPTRMLRMSSPWGNTIIAEVARSAPANMTRVSATPKTSPATSFAMLSPAAAIGPAVLTISTMPTPM